MSAANNQLWDVVIVGAGPAGSTAAIHLAGRGHDVLLLDKDDFPRDKVCGDALIADAIRALTRAGLYKSVVELGYGIPLGTVYSPSGIQFDVSGEFLTLKRLYLDELIQRRAVAAGAVFHRARATRIELSSNGTPLVHASGIREPLVCRSAFVATGAKVELPSELGLVSQQGPSAVALRCYVHSPIEVDRLIISYDRSIIPGYAWIFPLGNGEYNVGCGIVYRNGVADGVNLRNVFRAFVDNFRLASDLMSRANDVSPLRGAMLRCGLRGTGQSGWGNILIIGETIGATFPFTGEGIGKAMETGELAAELAHKALVSGDFGHLRQFPERLKHDLEPKFLGYRIAQDWLSKPWLNDLVARRVRKSKFLQEAIAAIVNETADPRTIFSLRGILRSFVS